MTPTLSPAEVAAMVGASESFIRAKVRRQEIPCLRVGRGAYRFTDAHITQILDHLTQPATP